MNKASAEVPEATTDALAERIQALASRQKKPAAPLAIPEWPHLVRGTPNAFLRSALFAAVQGKQRRVFKKRTLLASLQNIELRFQGVQLDQSDLDVWLQILHLARNQVPGFPVAFRAHALLTALNRGTGKGQYLWLADTLARLGGALVELTFEGRHTFGDHLLRYYRDELTHHYVVEPTEELCRLFLTGYSHIEWEQRQRLRRKPLTLWLHGYLSSHAAPYPIKISTLHRLCGSSSHSLRDFKARLRSALQELAEVGTLSRFEITRDGRVLAERPSSADHTSLSQNRHRSAN
jgi:hypothetical protein